MQKSSFFERSPIRSRSQSDWAAFAIRLGCVRNLIGLRSQSDWMRSENDDKSLVLNTPL